MKKFINVLAVLMALVMCLGVVVACANGDEEDAATEGTTTAASTTKPQAQTTTKPTQTTTTVEETTTDRYANRTKEPTVEVPADGVITTAEQLHAVLVKGAVDGNYTVNAATLDMSKYAWAGMTGFTGTFDFNGCVITGAIDSLFLTVLGGTVKNLTIADTEYLYTNDDATAEVDPKDNTSPNLHYSPVIRYATDVTVENVVIDKTVKVKSDIWTNNSCHGGIVGGAYGTSILVSNCHFHGHYESDSLVLRMGGVAGIINSSSASSVNMDVPEDSTVKVVNCTNTGFVNNISVGGDSKVAAVVGYLGNGAVIKCANYGEMDSLGAGQTAGVVGYVGGSTHIKDCVNTGKVKGANFTGGICGYSNGSARYFTNCINLGNVTSDTDNWGGVIGLIKSSETITNCFNLNTEAATTEFAHGLYNNVTAPVNPADPATHGSAVITNCANLDTVDAIFTAMDTVNAGVFEKTNGIIKVVIAQ